MKAIKKLILCKIETTYGVDAVPVAGTDDLLVLNCSVTPINIRYTDRNSAQPFFGNRGQINVGETMQIEYDIEVAGAGAAVDVPGYAAALRGCAMAETITPTTGPVTYTFVSDAEESVTQYFYWDGVLHKMIGAYGTIEWRFSESNVPLMHFTWEGLYAGVSEAAPGTPDLSAFQKGKAMTKANTTFTLFTYAAPLSSLTITQGNEHVYKNRPNSERMHYTNRVTKGQVVIECPKPTVKDFIAICRAETEGALALTHGTVAGNKATLTAGHIQLTNPRASEGDNIIMLTMDMNFLPSDAGNDEFSYATL
jgi:hypothetical protein